MLQTEAKTGVICDFLLVLVMSRTGSGDPLFLFGLSYLIWRVASCLCYIYSSWFLGFCASPEFLVFLVSCLHWRFRSVSLFSLFVSMCCMLVLVLRPYVFPVFHVESLLSLCLFTSCVSPVGHVSSSVFCFLSCVQCFEFSPSSHYVWLVPAMFPSCFSFPC